MQSQIRSNADEIATAEYTNTFGAVYAEKFSISTNEMSKVINLDNNVRKVRLIKRRNYRKNLLFFLKN